MNSPGEGRTCFGNKKEEESSQRRHGARLWYHVRIPSPHASLDEPLEHIYMDPDCPRKCRVWDNLETADIAGSRLRSEFPLCFSSVELQTLFVVEEADPI